MREIRIFVSSPGDAQFERMRLDRVVERLNGELAGTASLKTIRWEEGFYKAHTTFQTQIPEAAACDIVVAILRHRLGTALPDDFPRMPDGEPYPSGTAYEVLSAIEASRKNALPDVYVFRFTDPPTVRLDDPPARATVEGQWERLKAFFHKWFVTPDGQFQAAFQTFASTDDFEAKVETLLRRWLAEHILEGRSVQWPIEFNGSPFRGLDVFGARHASIFFGRSHDIARAVDLWKDAAGRGAPFLVVIGASGAGKSSLARAGLIPRMTAAGVVPTVDIWRVAALRPGERGRGPFAALADALLVAASDLPPEDSGRPVALPEIAGGDYRTPAELADLLSHADAAALRPITGALDRVAESVRAESGHDRPLSAALLLLVDQLDELFSGDIPEETTRRFAALLQSLVKSGRVFVLATLRSDLYASYCAVPELMALKAAGATYDLAAPGPAELAEIVRRPAEAADLHYEKNGEGRGLDERLLADADRADMLPLLEFTLNRLFEERRSAEGKVLLTHSAYDAMGGLDGAIDTEAERALATLGDAEIARLPRLLRDLAVPTRAGEGMAAAMTIRSAPRSRAAHDPAAARLVDALVAARILLGSADAGEPTIRIAHQRVLQSWNRAREIVAANAEFFRIREEIEDARRRWEAGGRTRDRLIPSGVPLAEAEKIAGQFGEELGAETRSFIAASGRRARLRQRLTAAAAIVFLAVAVGAGYFGWRASVAEDAATRNFTIARTTVDTIVFDIAQSLKNVEGMRLESLRRILGEVEKAVDGLAASTAGDAGLTRSRAVMQLLFGDVYLAAGDMDAARISAEESLTTMRTLAAKSPQSLDAERDVLVGLVRVADIRERTGDVKAARTNYEEALAIGRKLTKAEPDNALWNRDLAMVLERLSDMDAGLGDDARAQRLLEEALGLAGVAVQADPGDASALDGLSVMQENLGDLHVRRGALADAEASYSDALAIRRRLAAEDITDLDRQRGVAVALLKLGDVFVSQGNGSAAVPSYEEALGIMQGLLRSDEENAAWLLDVSVLTSKVGDMRLRQGDSAGAAAAFEEGLKISRQGVRQQPTDVGWQRNLAVGLNRLADLQLRQGDAAAALAAYEEALSIARRLAEGDPANIQYASDITFGLNKIAEAAYRSGDLTKAEADYEESLAENRRLAERSPDNVELRSGLAFTLGRLAAVRFAAGNALDALSALVEAISTYRDILEGEPDNAGAQGELSTLLASLGDVRLSSGDAAAAQAAYEEALALDRGIVASDPTNAGRRRNLSVTMNKIADLKLRNGDAEGAKAGYEEALSIVRALVGQDPTNTGWRRDVAFGLNRLGDLAARQGDFPAAKTRYEEALQIVRDLAAADPGSAPLKEDVALGLQRLGDLQASQGEIKAAIATYREELDLRRAVAATGPANAGWRRNLGLSLYRIGAAETELGDREAGLKAYEEAEGIARDLAGRDPSNITWQSDLAAVLLPIADLAPARRQDVLREALAIVEKLAAEGLLPAGQANLPDHIRTLLAE